MAQQLSFENLGLPPVKPPPRRPAPREPRRDPVFLALRPDEAATALILTAREEPLQRLRGKPVAPERFHVSIWGVCELRAFDRERAAAFRRAMGMLRSRAFEVTFDRLASFKAGKAERGVHHPCVLYGGDGLNGVERLRAEIAAAMGRVGLGRGRRSFAPHLTMFYGDWGQERPVAPIGWTVRELLLLHSAQGRATHHVLERFALYD